MGTPVRTYGTPQVLPTAGPCRDCGGTPNPSGFTHAPDCGYRWAEGNRAARVADPLSAGPVFDPDSHGRPRRARVGTCAFCGAPRSLGGGYAHLATCRITVRREARR